MAPVMLEQAGGGATGRSGLDTGTDIATGATATTDLDPKGRNWWRMTSAQGTRSRQQDADRASRPDDLLQQQQQQQQQSLHKNKPTHSWRKLVDVASDRSWLSKYQVQRSDGSIVIPTRRSSRNEHVRRGREKEPRYPFSPNWIPAWNFRPRDDAHTLEGEAGPTREEIEAAKRILERFPMAGSQRPVTRSSHNGGQRNAPRQRHSMIQTGEDVTVLQRMSATPPPIVRQRLVIRDDSFEESFSDDDQDIDMNMNTSRNTRRPSADQGRLRGPIKSESSLRDRRLSLQSTETQRRIDHPSLPPLREISFNSENTNGNGIHSRGSERSPVLDHIRLYEDAPTDNILPLTRPGYHPPDSPEDLNGFRPDSPHDFDNFDGCYIDNFYSEGQPGLPRGDIPRRKSSFKGTQKASSKKGSFQERLNSAQTGQRQPNVLRRRRHSDELGDVRRGGSTKSKESDGQHSVATSGSARMPDFFGPNIYQVVLQDPITAHQLLKFSESRLCGENLEFLQKVDNYHRLMNELVDTVSSIQKDYVSDSSPRQVNLQGAVLNRLDGDMRALMSQTLPQMQRMFLGAQKGVEDLIYAGVYPAFVRHQLALSASRALACDRTRYQGLGDSFTMTDPRLADNPIIFASDGFASLTGHPLSDIISKNCRVLQGKQTDKQAVARIRAAVREETEVVELVLNYKKNGDPFWNLLYIAPLFDEQGQLAFFIGGQVNCSTTIHSSADVMRVLSMSSDPSETDAKESPAKPGETTAKQPQATPQPPPPRKSSARKVLLKAFGVRTQDENEPSAQAVPAMAVAGMGKKLLSKMEGQDIGTQMREFYSSYSKYLVVDATFKIRFHSDGILTMLHPANNVGELAGTDIFHFLRQNTLTSSSANGNGHGHGAHAGAGATLPSPVAYKGRVRAALRAGSAISIQVRLQTRRSAAFRGDEMFAAHWTPLKDAKGEVCWVVLCLGAMLGE
ncbi:hypothetical protein MCOR27_001062 [Pyricularia oryzae]|uniref:LOV domain-containing protein n=1 Tax=Pyricularia grisea TaxID=148305 RepID=A0ABQ8NEL5_PYRGI|nr:hypothetical protein MCOR01_002669 [Pyricularia oryzae]KAI6295776.1 hypothetical protein MCOR33_007393 [Pyricularia grisea]KAI6256364.1 hypothetical protein MCOR19_007189 [Pyricularia oryzae]KAI6284692.1 hypothetical protein MCOR26_001818 [Pyricularia oryzae]KAI6288037.1 hypothetical protein MCOR27_001062 [Pyricularia oryzae]